MTILLALTTSIFLQVGDCEVCKAALEKDYLYTLETSQQQYSYLSILSQETFDELKRSGGGELAILAKIPIVSALIGLSADYSDFQTRRTKLFKEVGYSSTEAESKLTIQRVTSESAYPAFRDCIRMCKDSGLFLTATDCGPTDASFELIYRPQQNAPGLMSSSITGGSVVGLPLTTHLTTFRPYAFTVKRSVQNEATTATIEVDGMRVEAKCDYQPIEMRGYFSLTYKLPTSTIVPGNQTCSAGSVLNDCNNCPNAAHMLATESIAVGTGTFTSADIGCLCDAPTEKERLLVALTQYGSSRLAADRFQHWRNVDYTPGWQNRVNPCHFRNSVPSVAGNGTVAQCSFETWSSPVKVSVCVTPKITINAEVPVIGETRELRSGNNLLVCFPAKSTDRKIMATEAGTNKAKDVPAGSSAKGLLEFDQQDGDCYSYQVPTKSDSASTIKVVRELTQPNKLK